MFMRGDIGSFDNGDPNTTNIYLGNLNPKVSSLLVSIILVIKNGLFLAYRASTNGNIWALWPFSQYKDNVAKI